MKKFILIVTAFFLVTSFSFGFLWFESPALAKRKASLQAFVEEAVAYYNKYGEEVAFKEFQKKDGKFVRGEYYVFVDDFIGTTIVHPMVTSIVGKKLINMKDSKGKLFRQEFIKKVKENGKGWVEYHWTHPKLKKIRPKLVYLVQISPEYYLGSGMYKEVE